MRTGREEAARLLRVEPDEIDEEWDDPRNDCRWYRAGGQKVAVSFYVLRELEPPRTWQDDFMELAVIMWDLEKARRRREEAE